VSRLAAKSLKENELMMNIYILQSKNGFRVSTGQSYFAFWARKNKYPKIHLPGVGAYCFRNRHLESYFSVFISKINDFSTDILIAH